MSHLLRLTSHPPQRESEAYRLARLEALSPFDLQASPPLRLLLIRLSDSLHVLSVSLHHIISDGWSMGVLVREVALLYEAYAQGKPSPLAELPIQYADYAVWQRRRLESGALDGQRIYWEGKLRGAEAKLELATDRARPAVQSYRGGRERVEVGAEERASSRARR